MLLMKTSQQKTLNSLKSELGSVKGSKAEKEKEVERLMKELMVGCSPLSI